MLGNGAFLEEGLSLDFEEFEFHQFVILRETAEGGEHLSSFSFTIVVDEPTRGERHKENSCEENDGRE